MSIHDVMTEAIADQENDGVVNCRWDVVARAVALTLFTAGYRIVPIDPTDAMCIELGHLERDSAREAWRNTLAVAPQIDTAKEGQ